MSPIAPAAFNHVTVGVADLEQAVAFWGTHFGFEVRDRRDGPDAGLGRLWGIAAGRIRRQALVATRTATAEWALAGAIHLVEFIDPDPPVRRGAQAFDRLPKNLDLYTVDMPARHAALEAAGCVFRGPWAEMPVGEHRFREVHLAGHDDINVVLIEAIGPGYDTPMSCRGFAGIGPLVTIVADIDAEAAFYRDVLGLTCTLQLQLGGPMIERTVGLPAGAGLDIRVFGDPAEPLGRIEIIEYQHGRGADLYPRAKPPAAGILHVNYSVSDLEPLRVRLNAAGLESTMHERVAALFGSGPVLSFRSPAGFRIDVQSSD